jgi:hypothetical protein
MPLGDGGGFGRRARSAGRGNRDRDGQVAVVPGRAATVPPWTAAIEVTMARPSPKPSWDVRSLSRWKGWKMRSVSAGLMTGPVLATVSSLLPTAERVLTQMSPSGTL